MSDDCDPYQGAADGARAEWVRSNLEEEVERLSALIPKMNYIATYQAESAGGATFQNNAVLHNVAEGTSPEKIIEAVFEQASIDMAHRGMAITSVILLNLSRVY